MKRKTMIILAAILVLAAGFVIFEAAKLLQARAATPRLIADALTDTDIQITLMDAGRVAMVLAVEDPNFWQNDGTDASSPSHTTLSEELAKQFYFPNGFHPGFADIQLNLATRYALTPLVDKNRILRAILAKAPMGHDAQGPIKGFADASMRWFGSPLDQLSDDKFLALVAMMPAPDDLDPVHHAAANAAQVKEVKRQLSAKCAASTLDAATLQICG